MYVASSFGVWGTMVGDDGCVADRTWEHEETVTRVLPSSLSLCVSLCLSSSLIDVCMKGLRCLVLVTLCLAAARIHADEAPHSSAGEPVEVTATNDMVVDTDGSVETLLPDNAGVDESRDTVDLPMSIDLMASPHLPAGADLHAGRGAPSEEAVVDDPPVNIAGEEGIVSIDIGDAKDSSVSAVHAVVDLNRGPKTEQVANGGQAPGVPLPDTDTDLQTPSLGLVTPTTTELAYKDEAKGDDLVNTDTVDIHADTEPVQDIQEVQDVQEVQNRATEPAKEMPATSFEEHGAGLEEGVHGKGIDEVPVTLVDPAAAERGGGAVDVPPVEENEPIMVPDEEEAIMVPDEEVGVADGEPGEESVPITMSENVGSRSDSMVPKEDITFVVKCLLLLLSTLTVTIMIMWHYYNDVITAVHGSSARLQNFETPYAPIDDRWSGLPGGKKRRHLHPGHANTPSDTSTATASTPGVTPGLVPGVTPVHWNNFRDQKEEAGGKWEREEGRETMVDDVDVSPYLTATKPSEAPNHLPSLQGMTNQPPVSSLGWMDKKKKKKKKKKQNMTQESTDPMDM